MRALLLAAAIVAAFPASASANPWTRAQGGFFLNVSYSTITSGCYYSMLPKETVCFSPDGTRTFTQHNVGLYGEFGIVSRWLTATLDASLIRINRLSDSGQTVSPGDARLGLWSGVLTSPFHLALGVVAGIPIGDSHPRPERPSSVRGSGSLEYIAAKAVACSLPTGDGEPDVELLASAGHAFGGGWWPLQHFVRGHLGYWFHTSFSACRPDAGGDTGTDTVVQATREYFDAVDWGLQVGTKLPWPIVNRIWIIAHVFGVESFANHTEFSTSGGFSGLGNGVTHTSWGLELFGSIYKGLGMGLRFDGAFRARGIVAGAQYKLAISYER